MQVKESLWRKSSSRGRSTSLNTYRIYDACVSYLLRCCFSLLSLILLFLHADRSPEVCLTSTAMSHNWSHFTGLPTAAWRDLMVFSAYQLQAFKFPHFSDSSWKEFRLVAWEGTSGVSPLCSFSPGWPQPETSTALWPARDYSHWTQAIPLQPPGNPVKPVGGPQLYSGLSKMCLADCSPLQSSSFLVTTQRPGMAIPNPIITPRPKSSAAKIWPRVAYF